MNYTNTPSISIVTNFYNAEKFIKETIESVLSQTYKNWELILFDDGSNDNSTYIAKDYVKKYPGKILYYEHAAHENKGMSLSRNLGIKFAKGEFITFLDADDVFLPSNLEEQLKIFHKFPNISCVFGATKYWYSWNKSHNRRKDFVQTLQIPSQIYKTGELFKLFLTQKAATPSMSLMIRKNFIKTIGGFEEEFKILYSDQILYSKVSLEGTSFVDNNYYYLYRQHEDSYCSKSKKDGTVLLHEYKYLNWLLDYLQKKNIEDLKILRIIRKRIWLSKHPRILYLHRRLLKQKRRFSDFLRTIF